MPARWGAVAAYAAVAAANQLLWLTYAPITTATAEHFGVPESAVGWLSQVFPLLYVVLAIPAGIALDRRFSPALLTGAWLPTGSLGIDIDWENVPGGSLPVSFRFTAAADSAWLVDDVYVDPMARG